MTSALQEALISARMNKDMGVHANLGAHYANKRTHKQYLRANKLGKFRKGK
jgi:hypothetical protein